MYVYEQAKYFLIEYDSKAGTVRVKPYSNSTGGTKSFDNVEAEIRRGSAVNAVLVEADKIEGLKAAYPNYFGDVQVFKENLKLLTKKEGGERVQASAATDHASAPEGSRRYRIIAPGPNLGGQKEVSPHRAPAAVRALGEGPNPKNPSIPSVNACPWPRQGLGAGRGSKSGVSIATIKRLEAQDGPIGGRLDTVGKIVSAQSQSPTSLTGFDVDRSFRIGRWTSQLGGKPTSPQVAQGKDLNPCQSCHSIAMASGRGGGCDGLCGSCGRTRASGLVRSTRRLPPESG